ncbi:MAG: sigma 54-interacting transcriptional regulator [Gemmataceae bacterium]|nr:sigma 54-interacting transcriptional regulator [Gemmataceae bacterium]MDW8265413.1 sigma 54-interacting transcriptional regulator [Gemmataceae bacterium]
MPSAPTAYLVVHRDDGSGEVHPLYSGHRYTIGRAPSCGIVIRDDQCSREHAEVYEAAGRWCICDLNSLNGTRVNEQRLEGERALTGQDVLLLGRTRLVYVEDPGQLTALPSRATAGDGWAIRKRLGQTRFLKPVSETRSSADADDRPRVSRDLALLYRLALDMGSANTHQELARIVLDGLLEGIAADVGAILEVKENRDVEVLAHRHRDPEARSYHKVSRFVSSEVISSREAILAENVSRHRHLSGRESLLELGVTSLICAPAIVGPDLLGLIHLYCTSPHRSLDPEDLEFTMAVAKQYALATRQLQRQASLSAENRLLRDQLRVESELIGESPAIREILGQIARVARTNATVLIRGESGVGKELVARAIHHSSLRKDGPFVCLNCAALTETLLESELFGHERGAFTGATEKMIGKFEAAHRGTIFLDEIGELTPSTQAKLLRVLEGHPFERVGGSTPIHVDVRVVAATNQPLEKALQTGQFRRDLFYRLQVVEIRVPPLWTRTSDIPLLAQHFLKRFARETGRKIHGFTPAALKKLQEYPWPGNVRELKNVIERAVALGAGPTIDVADLRLGSPAGDGAETMALPGNYQPISLEELEKRHIARTLQHTGWNKSRAASILGIERTTLDRKIKLYDLRRQP